MTVPMLFFAALALVLGLFPGPLLTWIGTLTAPLF
jgi:hypothetical protein